MKGHRKCLHFLRKYSNIIWRCEKHAVYMQRCLSGLRSTIGNRVMRERIRRFESSSLRQQIKGFREFCRKSFFCFFPSHNFWLFFWRCVKCWRNGIIRAFRKCIRVFVLKRVQYRRCPVMHRR